MRTTLRIDDDLVRALKDLAHEEDISFGRTLNRVLRAGLAARRPASRSRKRFRQETFDLGEPSVGLDKALALVAAIEDEENTRKLALRK
ncbi:MAG: antitoxin [Hyphomicrobiaceae bacterium]|nr:MAG: antitoxin [Hyphomicrobiaceae bacterium]